MHATIAEEEQAGRQACVVLLGWLLTASADGGRSVAMHACHMWGGHGPPQVLDELMVVSGILGALSKGPVAWAFFAFGQSVSPMGVLVTPGGRREEAGGEGGADHRLPWCWCWWWCVGGGRLRVLPSSGVLPVRGLRHREGAEGSRHQVRQQVPRPGDRPASQPDHRLHGITHSLTLPACLPVCASATRA